jgi:hypothetical protein
LLAGEEVLALALMLGIVIGIWLPRFEVGNFVLLIYLLLCCSVPCCLWSEFVIDVDFSDGVEGVRPQYKLIILSLIAG